MTYTYKYKECQFVKPDVQTASFCIRESDDTKKKETEIEIRPSKKGAEDGVIAGAIVGSVLGPGGAVVGALIGGVVGYIFGPDDKKENK